jgi:hypothetical protein
MALRERTGTLDLESRPSSSSTRDKKLNFLQRWVMNHHQHRRTTSATTNTTTIATNNNNIVGGIATASVGGGAGDGGVDADTVVGYNSSNLAIPSMLSSSSTSTVTANPTATTFKSKAARRQQYNVYSATATTYSTPTTFNVLHWMQADCPVGILPRILAFAGPQTSMALSRTNQFWNHVLQDDATWRVLCEELYKVRSTTKQKCLFAQHPEFFISKLPLSMSSSSSKFCL